MKLVMRFGILSLVFTSLAIFSCRTTEDDGNLESRGGNVNNGTGPDGDIITCSGKTLNKENIYFFVRDTAVITLKQGILSYDQKVDGKDTFFYCKWNNMKKIDMECSLTDENATTKSTVIIKQNGRKIEATYSVDQMHPLPPQVQSVMTCKDLQG